MSRWGAWLAEATRVAIRRGGVPRHGAGGQNGEGYMNPRWGPPVQAPAPIIGGLRGRSKLQWGRVKVASIESIARGLNDASVPFVIVGGLAVVAHGYGRQTQDIDLVVPMDPGTVRGMFAALARLGYAPRIPVAAEDVADPGTRARWIAERGMVVLAFHSEAHADTPVDVFMQEPFDFEAEHAAADIREIAPGLPVRIVRLATLLSMKERAGRPQDRADVAELLRIHGGRSG